MHKKNLLKKSTVKTNECYLETCTLLRFFISWMNIICLITTVFLSPTLQARQVSTPFLLSQGFTSSQAQEAQASSNNHCVYSENLESMQSCFENQQTEEFPVIWSWVLLIAAAAVAPLLLFSILTVDTGIFAGLIGGFLIWEIATTWDYDNKRDDLYKRFEELSKQKANVQVEALMKAIESSRQNADFADSKAMKLEILSYAMFGLAVATAACAAAFLPFLKFFCTGPGSVGSVESFKNTDMVSSIPKKTPASDSPFFHLKNTSPFMGSPRTAGSLDILFPKAMAAEEKKENSYFINNVLIPLGIGGGAAAAVLLVAYDAVMGFLGPVLKIVWVRVGIYAAIGILAQVAKEEIKGAAQQFRQDGDNYQKILDSYKDAAAKTEGLPDGSKDPGVIENDAPEMETFRPERPGGPGGSDGLGGTGGGCRQLIKGKIVPDPKCSCKPNCKTGKQYGGIRTPKGHWASSNINDISRGFKSMNTIGRAAANGHLAKLNTLPGAAAKQATRIHGAIGSLESQMNRQRKQEGKEPVHLLKEGSGTLKKLHGAVKKAVNKLPENQRGTVDPFGNFHSLSGDKNITSAMGNLKKGKHFLSGQKGNKHQGQLKNTSAGKKGSGGFYKAISDFLGGEKKKESDTSNGGMTGEDESTDSSTLEELKKGNWSKGDIHQNSSLSIFGIITQRYLKSAYARLLKKRSDS